MFDDFKPRYAPENVIVVVGGGFRLCPVKRFVFHPAGAHPKGCPLVSSVGALELQTEGGSRWYGCERAYINSELRMVVVGANSWDESRMRWPEARD